MGEDIIVLESSLVLALTETIVRVSITLVLLAILVVSRVWILVVGKREVRAATWWSVDSDRGQVGFADVGLASARVDLAEGFWLFVPSENVVVALVRIGLLGSVDWLVVFEAAADRPV